MKGSAPISFRTVVFSFVISGERVERFILKRKVTTAIKVISGERVER